MTRWTRVTAMAALALAGVFPAVEAGAATDPVTQLRTGIYCEMEASPEGFTVSWNHDDVDDVSRVVVERQVLGRFWWRGRFDPEQRSFTDGVAPSNAARADYRVIAKNEAGTELDRADCELVSTPDLRCTVTRTDDGYRIDIDRDDRGEPVDGDVDYVVRRSVTPGGTPYWRGRTDESSFDDTSAVKPFVGYQVWTRADRRIIGGTTCENDLANPACFTPLASRSAAEALPQDTMINYNGDLIEQIDALVPGQQLQFVVPFADSRFIYTRDHDGHADLWLYDDRDQSNRLVAEDLGPTDGGVFGYYVDEVGGVYTNLDDEAGVGYWYFAPGGISQLMTVEPFGTFDLIQPIGDLPDGRTVLYRRANSMNDLSSESVFSRILLRTPGTDDYTALSDLDGFDLIGVTDEGDLLLGSLGPLGWVYSRFDHSCIDD